MDAAAQISGAARLKLAQRLSALEAQAPSPAILEAADAAWIEGEGLIIGLTGPPGVGKSTLIGGLITTYRARGLRVGVLAIDPSSQVGGGALLGDRIRLTGGPRDGHVFVRSMAARDRLGGLSPGAAAAAALMSADFDRVIVETVGTGQSETAIADLADCVAACLQPGGGDALQFLKAGLMEIPQVLAILKADLPAAIATDTELRAALNALGSRAPIELVSAERGEGLAALANSVDTEALAGRTRRAQRGTGLIQAGLRHSFGREGAQAIPMSQSDAPFVALHNALESLRERFLSSRLEGR
jgi:LAO/AO transport system kinase